MKKVIVLILLLGLAGPALAASIDIGFNDFSAQGEFTHPLVRDDYGTSQINARLLYNDDEETTLGSVGFDFMGEPGNIPGLDLGLGAQLGGGQTDESQDFLTLGVGTRVGYAPPVWRGLGISGKLIYSPEIFSWLDAERMLETGVRVAYALTPKVRLHVGYQNIRSEFEQKDTWIIDEAVRVGFEARF